VVLKSRSAPQLWRGLSAARTLVSVTGQRYGSS
jgi:hypothetical protein